MFTIGEIVRYGPNRYSFSSPGAQKTIYGHGAKFPKSSWYATWQNPHPDQWSLFADQSIPRHSENRRQYQSAYTMSSLVNYESYVDECADLFSQRLQEVASAGAYADMGHWLQCYAFDVIGMITFSKRLGFLDKGEDIRGILVALEDLLWYATLTGTYSWLHKYLAPIRNFLAGPKGTGRAYVMKFTQECIMEHQQEHAKGIPVDGAEEGKGTSMDFLTKFFKKNADDPKSFSMYHLTVGCVSNMTAGSDTTAISLSAILYYMLKNPQTFETLRQEIDERQREGKIGHYITFKESQDMPYLQAVMKEALRMHPATGLPLERVVPAGGASICDRFFPEGVSCCVYQFHVWRADRLDRQSSEPTPGSPIATRQFSVLTHTCSGLSAGSAPTKRSLVSWSEIGCRYVTLFSMCRHCLPASFPLSERHASSITFSHYLSQPHQLSYLV